MNITAIIGFAGHIATVEVLAETAKAVRVRNDGIATGGWGKGRTTWLPKAALVPSVYADGYAPRGEFKLAPWFRPDIDAQRALYMVA